MPLFKLLKISPSYRGHWGNLWTSLWNLVCSCLSQSTSLERSLCLFQTPYFPICLSLAWLRGISGQLPRQVGRPKAGVFSDVRTLSTAISGSTLGNVSGTKQELAVWCTSKANCGLRFCKNKELYCKGSNREVRNNLRSADWFVAGGFVGRGRREAACWLDGKKGRFQRSFSRHKIPSSLFKACMFLWGVELSCSAQGILSLSCPRIIDWLSWFLLCVSKLSFSGL